MWTISPTPRAHRGHYTIRHNHVEVGTFSLLTELYYPETVLAAIVAALEADHDEGRF